MMLNLPAAELSQDDWDQIERAFSAGSKFLDVIAKLRANNNTPMKASDLLEGKNVNDGHTAVSLPLRLAKLPFRLSRIGALPYRARGDRMLAFVRLTEEIERSLAERAQNRAPQQHRRERVYSNR